MQKSSLGKPPVAPPSPPPLMDVYGGLEAVQTANDKAKDDINAGKDNADAVEL